MSELAPRPVEDEPLSLIGEDEAPKPHAGSGIGQSSVRTFGAKMGHLEKKHEFKRQPSVSGQGAVRCRLFHSKIAATSMDYMQGQINEWLDHENIEVKHVGHVIGTLEGKTPEPNLIVIVWY